MSYQNYRNKQVAVKVGYSNLACEALKLCKVIEQQVWHHQTPLRQFNAIRTETCMKVERANLKIHQLCDYNTGELGRMIRDQRNAAHVKKLAYSIPRLALDCKARPITRTLLAVDISLEPKFRWVMNQHGKTQLFHVWVDDVIKREIYHHETYTMTDKDYAEQEELSVSIVLPIPEGDDEIPPQYQIHFISGFWLGSHSIFPLSFQHLIRPEDYPPETLLLDLHPLPIKALQNEKWESLYKGKFEYFNPIQTQVFHVAYHTDNPVLMCAPTGSGKTVIAELVTFRSLNVNPNKKIIYIAPLKALARERYRAWGQKFGEQVKISFT